MRLLKNAAESSYAKSFDGTPIYWERHGPTPKEAPDATPMLFCYGLVCSVNQWRKQIDRYSPMHPCYVFDYRAHHLSGHPADPSFLNMGALARDLKAVYDDAGLSKPAHIWGHSMGCHVALEFAFAFPELAKTLVLCCGTPNSPFANMFGSKAPEKLSVHLFNLLGSYPELFFKGWELFKSRPRLTELVSYAAGFNTDTSTRDDIRAYAHAVSEVDSQVFFTLLEEMSTGQIKNILAKVKTPTLVVAGALDRVTPPSEQQELANCLPDAEYVEIPAGSHNVQLDFGEYVGLKTEDFWRKRGLP